MRRIQGWIVFSLFVGAIIVPQKGWAESLFIGGISFDSTGLGTNTFDLNNFTDGFVSPDGIADSELFSGSLTVHFQGGSSSVYNFSGIDPLGVVSPTIVTLPGTDNILSATLSLTLSNSIGVNIFDDLGNPVVANLASVPNITVAPLGGGTILTACDANGDPCSSSAVYVSTAPVTPTIPEPDTFWLVASGGGALALRRRFLHLWDCLWIWPVRARLRM